MKKLVIRGDTQEAVDRSDGAAGPGLDEVEDGGRWRANLLSREERGFGEQVGVVSPELGDSRFVTGSDERDGERERGE